MTETPTTIERHECRRDRRGDVLAYGALTLLLILAVMATIVLFHGVPSLGDGGTIVIQIVTAIISIAGIVYGFQFGSSQGSQDKTDHMATAIPTPPPAQPKEP